ncbi:MAG: hypothetical protein AABZ60_09905 [Planctomycetota bacterium]
MKYFLFFCFFLSLEACHREESPPEITPSILISIHSVSDLKRHLDSSLALSPQALEFVETCSLEQKMEALLLILEPSSTFSQKAIDLFSIVALKDTAFQEELLRLLDTGEIKKIELGERLLPRIGGPLLLKASVLAPPLSETGQFYLLRCLRKRDPNDSLLDAIQTLLASHNSSEQQFGLKSLDRLSKKDQESILSEHLGTPRIQTQVALKLAYLENPLGADLLLDSLLSPENSSEWEMEVGKAFFKLGKKGVPSFRKGLQSNNTEKIKQVLQLQQILKQPELLTDLLPFLEVPTFRDQVRACLCVATKQDMKFDQEAWKKILQNRK